MHCLSSPRGGGGEGEMQLLDKVSAQSGTGRVRGADVCACVIGCFTFF